MSDKNSLFQAIDTQRDVLCSCLSIAGSEAAAAGNFFDANKETRFF